MLVQDRSGKESDIINWGGSINAQRHRYKSDKVAEVSYASKLLLF